MIAWTVINFQTIFLTIITIAKIIGKTFNTYSISYWSSYIPIALFIIWIRSWIVRGINSVVFLIVCSVATCINGKCCNEKLYLMLDRRFQSCVHLERMMKCSILYYLDQPTHPHYHPMTRLLRRLFWICNDLEGWLTDKAPSCNGLHRNMYLCLWMFRAGNHYPGF